MAEPAAAITTKPPLLDRGGLVVLTYSFPPMMAGTSFVIDRLLSQFELADTIVFAGVGDRVHPRDGSPASSRVEVRHRDVPLWWPPDFTVNVIGGRRIRVRLRALANIVVGIRVALEAAGALRSERSRGLLVVYPKQGYLLAGAIAAGLSRKPLLVYFMDVYVEGLGGGRRVGRLIERYVLRRASVVFAMSEPHREHIERRCRAVGAGRTRVVELPHTFEEIDLTPAPPSSGRPSIVFTGSIYGAQADAIRRLIASLDHPALDGLEPRLHLLSPTAAELVGSYGVHPGPTVSLRSASNKEALAVQRSADILFLAIAFDLTPEVARTASPGMPEYLAAGRPILVHAPPDSYAARYAREHGFAEVVDEPDVEALAQAIRRLATDERRCRELIGAAAETFARHRVATVAQGFRENVNAAVAGSSAR